MLLLVYKALNGLRPKHNSPELLIEYEALFVSVKHFEMPCV